MLCFLDFVWEGIWPASTNLRCWQKTREVRFKNKHFCYLAFLSFAVSQLRGGGVIIVGCGQLKSKERTSQPDHQAQRQGSACLGAGSA